MGLISRVSSRTYRKMSPPSERLKLNNGYAWQSMHETTNGQYVKQDSEIKMQFFKPNLNDPFNTETLPKSNYLDDSEIDKINSLRSVIIKFLTRNNLIGENMGVSRPILTSSRIHRTKDPKIIRKGYRTDNFELLQKPEKTRKTEPENNHGKNKLVVVKISETIELSAIKTEFSKYGVIMQIFRSGRLCVILFEKASAAADAVENSRVKTRFLRFDT